MLRKIPQDDYETPYNVTDTYAYVRIVLENPSATLAMENVEARAVSESEFRSAASVMVN